MPSAPGVICLFEDRAASRLAPLTCMRPVFDLRCGMRTLREKILSYYPDRPCRLWLRPELRTLTQEQCPGIPVNTRIDQPALFINGRVVMDDTLARVITADGPDGLYLCGETPIAARLADPSKLDPGAGFETDALSSTVTERAQIQARLIDYPWDLIRWNQDELFRDAGQMDGETVHLAQYPHVHAIDEGAIRVGPETVIMPGVVLDATGGPIAIGSHVQIMPFTYIQGPVSIGAHTVIRAGTRLYAGTSIGPTCRIGGEIAASIMQGYSNKQHDGFLGHACLGEWVNLGAGTTGSNLKNTYGAVSVVLAGRRIDTGMTFLGLIMGDYAKAGINTAFNTGTVIGFSSHTAGGGMPPKYMPPFTWHTPDGITEFQPDKALEIAQRMMTRRQMTLTPAAIQRFRQVFEESAHERMDLHGAQGATLTQL